MGGSEGIAPHILILALYENEWSWSRSGPSMPPSQLKLALLPT